MTLRPEQSPCGQTDLVCAYAIQAVPESEVAQVERHIASCERCRQEVETLRPVIEAFVHWPTDILRPHESLQERLMHRVRGRADPQSDPCVDRPWLEPDWKAVSRGIRCKVLAMDSATTTVSMLVQLDAGAAYPPHVHAGVEELYVLDGELWIDDRKLHAGSYNRGEPGTGDERVWSETGCTGLLITSTLDVMKVPGQEAAAE